MNENFVPMVKNSSKSSIKYHILSNLMKVLLIHNPNAEESCCSLSLESSFKDNPDSTPDLSFVTAHSILMGSKNFKAEDCFDSWMNKNKADYTISFNSQFTIFSLRSPTSIFQQMLERFLDSLADPLLKKSMILNGYQAGKKNWCENKKDSDFKNYYIQKSLFPLRNQFKKEVFTNNFNNKKNAVNPDKVKAFWESNYHSNKMALCIYSNIPHEKLIQLLEAQKIKPGPVCTSNVEPYTDFDDLVKDHLIQYKAENNEKELCIVITLPSDADGFVDKSLKYISTIISNTGLSSLAEKLLKADLVTKLGINWAEEYSNVFYKISFELTDKGLKDYQTVINIFYQYLSNIGISKSEIQKLDKMDNFICEYAESDIYYRFLINQSYLIHREASSIDILKRFFTKNRPSREFVKQILDEMLKYDKWAIILRSDSVKVCSSSIGLSKLPCNLLSKPKLVECSNPNYYNNLYDKTREFVDIFAKQLKNYIFNDDYTVHIKNYEKGKINALVGKLLFQNEQLSSITVDLRWPSDLKDCIAGGMFFKCAINEFVKINSTYMNYFRGEISSNFFIDRMKITFIGKSNYTAEMALEFIKFAKTFIPKDIDTGKKLICKDLENFKENDFTTFFLINSELQSKFKAKNLNINEILDNIQLSDVKYNEKYTIYIKGLGNTSMDDLNNVFEAFNPTRPAMLDIFRLSNKIINYHTPGCSVIGYSYNLSEIIDKITFSDTLSHFDPKLVKISIIYFFYAIQITLLKNAVLTTEKKLNETYDVKLYSIPCQSKILFTLNTDGRKSVEMQDSEFKDFIKRLFAENNLVSHKEFEKYRSELQIRLNTSFSIFVLLFSCFSSLFPVDNLIIHNFKKQISEIISILSINDLNNFGSTIYNEIEKNLKKQ